MPRLLRAPCTSKLIKIKFFKRETVLQKFNNDVEIEIKKQKIQNVFGIFMYSYLFSQSFNSIRYWENMTVLNSYISYNFYNSIFLGRVVSMDMSKQLISVSSGLNNNGLFKLPKKAFNSVYSNLKSPTLDGVRLYLPFINNPSKNTTSDCFLLADMYDYAVDKKKSKQRRKPNTFELIDNSSWLKMNLIRTQKKKVLKFYFRKTKTNLNATTRCNFIL